MPYHTTDAQTFAMPFVPPYPTHRSFMKTLIHIALLVWLPGNACLAETAATAPEPTIQAISLDTAANQLVNDPHQRVLGAATEQIDDRLVHVIKVLTEQGHIRHYKFDAGTGRPLDN